jgi:hypothetical protein
MLEANSDPILSNPPSRYPRNVPQPAQKTKLLDRLREPLRSRHGLFHLAHVDRFRLNIPSPIGACVAIKKTPSFPRNLSLHVLSRERESRESKFERCRHSWARMKSRPR